MKNISIYNLGISALLIEAGNRRILIDAFNNLITPVNVLPKDIIVFTHCDDDHFCPERLPDLRGTDIIIIGPPTIVKPILLLKKANIEQIEVLYSGEQYAPATICIDSMNISCLRTKHFNHWDPLHISYVIEVSGKKIYITGDSIFTDEQKNIIGTVDAVVCNLVDEGFLRGSEEAKVANQHILSYLLKVRALMKNAKIIGVHLLEASFTVDAENLNNLVKLLGFDESIIIPICPQQKVVI